MGNPSERAAVIFLYWTGAADEKLGIDQRHTYVKERLAQILSSVTTSLSSASLQSERSQASSYIDFNNKEQLLTFSRLYIASQICIGNLDEFFQHENQARPLALSQMGVLRTGTVRFADLLAKSCTSKHKCL